MCHTTFHLHLHLLPVPSPPTAITRFREMTLISSLCHRCCLWINPHWMLNIHHPPRHPGETRHPLINSPSVSLLVSLSTHLSLVIHRGISLVLTISQQKTNYVLTRGGNGAELKCSPAPDAYFPAEYLNDTVWSADYLACLSLIKPSTGRTSNFDTMDLMGCSLLTSSCGLRVITSHNNNDINFHIVSRVLTRHYMQQPWSDQTLGCMDGVSTELWELWRHRHFDLPPMAPVSNPVPILILMFYSKREQMMKNSIHLCTVFIYVEANSSKMVTQ